MKRRSRSGTSDDVVSVLSAVDALVDRQRALAAMIAQLDPKLVAQALHCFESAEAVGLFLITPTKSLGGKAPVEVARNARGFQRVRQILNAIEHGVYL